MPDKVFRTVIIGHQCPIYCYFQTALRDMRLKRCLLFQSLKSARLPTDGLRVRCRCQQRKYHPPTSAPLVSARALDSAYPPCAHHGKHFFAIVNVPLIRMIRPMQAHGSAVHIGNIQRTPCTISGKFGTTDLLAAHAFSFWRFQTGLTVFY